MIVRKAPVYAGHEKPWPLTFCHEQVLIYDRRVARAGPNPNRDKLELTTREAPVRLKAPLWHFSSRNLNHAVTKTIYVAKLAADTQAPRSAFALALRLPLEFPFAFVKYYVLRRHFLGGVDGFTYGMAGAFSRFIRIAMTLDRRKYPRERAPNVVS